MDSFDVMETCREFSRLGTAVQDQLEAVLSGDEALEDQNVNALAMVHEFCKRVTDRMDDPEFNDFASALKELDDYASEGGFKFEFGRVRTDAPG